MVVETVVGNRGKDGASVQERCEFVLVGGGKQGSLADVLWCSRGRKLHAGQRVRKEIIFPGYIFPLEIVREQSFHEAPQPCREAVGIGVHES